MVDEQEEDVAQVESERRAPSTETPAKPGDETKVERRVVVGETVRYTGKNGIALDAVVSRLDGETVDLVGALNEKQKFTEVPFDAFGGLHTYAFKERVAAIIHGRHTEVGSRVHYTDGNGRLHTAVVTRLDGESADLETEAVEAQTFTGVPHSMGGPHTWNHVSGAE